MSHNTYLILMYCHLLTVTPCIFLGLYLFFKPKGSKHHKTIGKLYMALMLITSLVSLCLPARVGPQLFNHFGFIHLFSLLTLYSIPTAIIAIKKGDVRKHRNKLVSLYAGAIVIAGGFTLAPGRFLHELFF